MILHVKLNREERHDVSSSRASFRQRGWTFVDRVYLNSINFGRNTNGQSVDST